MSEPNFEDIWKDVHASTVEATAARWLARQEHDALSEAEQSELNAWLAEASAHMVTYLRLRDVWARANRLAALRAPMRESTRTFRGQSSTRFVKSAAGAFVVAGGAIFAIAGVRNMPSETTYNTPVGGREIIALSDGSQVELNTDTILQIAKGNPRSVTLVKGEAFFQIKHNAAHPFVVSAFGHRITDLGTKFAVSGAAQHLVVTLVEGKARVDAGGMEHASAVLAPGDVAVAGLNTVSVTKRAPAILSDQLAWRQGMLVFTHATLAEVAEQFNRYNSRKIVISDPNTARLAIMGKFPVNDVDLFGRVAKAVLGVTVTQRGEEIIVSSNQGDK